MRVGEVHYSAADTAYSLQCTSPKLGTRDVQHIRYGPEHASAADLIKRVFRTRLAERAYKHMFDNGTCFTQMKLYGELKGSGTASLNKISQGFMVEVKDRLGQLSAEEQAFTRAVLQSRWSFRHQSNYPLDANGRLCILSNLALNRAGIGSESNTMSVDIERLSNNDFVFFAVETARGDEPKINNTMHGGINYGTNAYLINEDDPRVRHGYLTLTDQYVGEVHSGRWHEHQELFNRFPELSAEVERAIHEKKYLRVPMFSFNDMKEGVALYLIDYLRGTQVQGFRDYALACTSGSLALDRLIFHLFNLEFHVPRIASTFNYQTVKLSEYFDIELIKMADFEALDEQLVNGSRYALETLMGALELKVPSVVLHVLRKCSFSKAEIDDWYKVGLSVAGDATKSDLVAQLLDPDTSIDVLKAFIDRGLVDVHQKGADGRTLSDKIKSQEGRG
jgi:hypothetical protein